MAERPDYTFESEDLLPRPSISSNRDDAEQGLQSPDKEAYRDEPNTPRAASPIRQPTFRRRNLSFLRRLLGVAPWILVGMVLAWMMSALFYQVRPFKVNVTILKDMGEGKEPEQLHNDTLPPTPMPIIVTDEAGKQRWTVSIPPTLEFPLKPEDYADMCSKAHTMTKHLDEEIHNGPGHYPYYHVDEKFMNVADAEEQNLLPTNPVLKYSSEWSSSYDTGHSNTDSAGHCKRSLTFVMETKDAGLGNTLMLLWTSYGLAKKEGRAFFVDDRNWAYGKYSDYFQPPPEQSCLPPPENHRLSCPHHVNHLLVSRATQSYVFGHQFTEEFEDPKKMEVERQHNIFGLMRDGYEALYHLAEYDQKYLDDRVKKIHSEVGHRGGVEVGLHVRHGDLHPWEFQFSQSYIPLERFIDVAWDQAKTAHNEKIEERDAVFNDLKSSRMILASDDALVYSTPDMAKAMRAQDLIKLEDEPPLDPTSTEDENSPWEGGFEAETFWSLGNPTKAKEISSKKHPKPGPRDFDDKGQRVAPSSEASKLRAHVARSYFLDLAVLSQTDRVVCTVSSIGCRLIAVMMGWDKAIEKQHWVNIDGQWHWTGIRW